MAVWHCPICNGVDCMWNVSDAHCLSCGSTFPVGPNGSEPVDGSEPVSEPVAKSKKAKVEA